MNNTAIQLNRAEEYVNSLDLDYKAEFVPMSQSRNADEKYPSGLPMPTLNWRVTVGPITTDYMQGIAHMPGYKYTSRLTVLEHETQLQAAEKGRTARGKIPAPSLTDVLYSLVMDSEAIDYPAFKDWADTFGYDSDSRSAEKTYRACLEIALKLRQVIDLDDAREAFADY